jgi:hypothetical protein
MTHLIPEAIVQKAKNELCDELIAAAAQLEFLLGPDERERYQDLLQRAVRAIGPSK